MEHSEKTAEKADGVASSGDMYAGTTNEPLLKTSEAESTSATTPDDEIDEKKPKRPVIIDPKKKTQELTTFDRRNFLLHQYYIQRDFSSCKALIKEMLDESKGMNEYATYVRGKIARIEGNLRESLEWFEKAFALYPQSAKYMCQIGRVHFLLGNHEKASEILMDAIKLDPNNSKAYYWRSMALYHIDHSTESITKAQECLVSAPNAAKSAEILTFLAKLFAQKNEIIPAIEAYKKVLELEPENLDVLTNVGLLYLRTHSEDQAFSILGKALSYDPTHAPSILAAGSIIQANGDYDVALAKYRVAADKCDYNGPLWNNIGMCFFGKGKYVAAISCLKKANYLCPLDWKICYNLGLVHNAMQQYASAYHFISSAVNLNPRSPMVFMALAVVLTNLDDVPNARKAYDRAVHLEKGDNPQILLNYAIFEAKQNELEKSTEYLNRYEEIISKGALVSQQLRQGAENLKKALLQLSTAQTENAQANARLQQQKLADAKTDE